MAGWITRTLNAVRGAVWPTAALEAEHVMPATLDVIRRAGLVDPRNSATIPAVYRALDVLTTGVQQLTLTATRSGRRVTHQIVRRPSLTMTRSDWLGQYVLAMATDGNAFVHVRRASGAVLSLDLWDPTTVHVEQNPTTGQVRYWHDGRAYPATDVLHLAKLRLPGQTRGLGPIQAAQATLRGALDLRDSMAGWFDQTGQPAGVLTSDQALTAADAKAYRNAWNNLDETGQSLSTQENPSRIKVLGKGLAYEPILLKPADALWLEAQAFNTVEVARLFGIPAGLMMAAPDGDSQTYSNVEQEWIGFTRFTLMSYLRPLEEALSQLLEVEVRFVVDALLRTDTKTRYESHQIGITAGFLTPNEVRALEGLAPLDGGDDLTRTNHTTPAQEVTP